MCILFVGWQCGSVVEHLSGAREALGSLVAVFLFPVTPHPQLKVCYWSQNQDTDLEFEEGDPEVKECSGDTPADFSVSDEYPLSVCWVPHDYSLSVC